MKKAVLFDLDGTLANTLTDIAAAMNRALRLHGLPEHPVDAYKLMVGNGAVKLSFRAVGEHTELQPQVLADYQHYYENHTLDTTLPYPGIMEMLSGLKARGLRLCVFSNKPHADSQTVVHALFPEGTFELVRGQQQGVPVKPDPAGALLAAEAMGLAPQDFYYLGDSAPDMQCARAAGMLPVGVLWGFRSAEELKENGAALLLSRPEELLQVIDQEVDAHA